LYNEYEGRKRIQAEKDRAMKSIAEFLKPLYEQRSVSIFSDQIVRQILRLSIGIALFSIVFFGIVWINERVFFPWLIGAFITVLTYLIIINLFNRGHVGLVKFLLVFINIVVNFMGILFTGGVYSPNVFALIEPVIVATFLYGVRGIFGTFLVYLAATILVLSFPAASLPPGQMDPLVLQLFHFFTLPIYFFYAYRLVDDEFNRNEQIKRQLALNEKKARDLVLHLPLSSLVANVNGKVELVNERLVKMTGYTADELKTIYDWYARAYADPQAKNWWSNYWQAQGLGRDVPFILSEKQIRTKSGQLLDAEVYITQYGDQIIMMLNDITERKKAVQEMEMQLRRIELLNRLQRQVLSARTPLRVAEAALRSLKDMVPYFIGAITLYEQHANTFKTLATNVTVPTGEEICKYYDQYAGYLFDTCTLDEIDIVLIKDLNAVANNDIHRKLSSLGVRTILTLPLKAGRQFIGFMSLFSAAPDAYNAEHIEISREVRDSITLAIRQSRLLEAERRRRKSLEIIESISLDIRKADDKINLYSQLMENCLRRLDAKAGLVFEQVGKQLECVMTYGMDWPSPDARVVDEFKQRLDEFARSGQNVGFFQDERRPNRTLVLVRLYSEAYVFGYLALFWQSSMISPDTQTILQTLSEFGGIALERISVLETLEERITRRTRELQALYEIIRLYVSNEDIEYVIDESLKIIVANIHAAAGVVFQAESASNLFKLTNQLGFDPCGRSEGAYIDLANFGWRPVLESDKPVLLSEPLYPFSVPESGAPSRTQNLIGVPIRSEDKLLGVIALLFTQEINVSLDELSLVNLLADQLGMVLERNILRQQAEKAAVMDERQRLSRELHDSLMQSLYSLKLISDVGIRYLKRQKWDDVETQLNTIYDISMQALKEMRLLVYDLIPETIEQQGLIAALEQRLNFVEKRAGLLVDFSQEGPLDIPTDTQVDIYRITQEALNNAVKHAAATKISVAYQHIDHVISISVTDNGKGFDPTQVSKGMGLKNMQDRAHKLGGRIKINSIPGKGTTILFEMDELMV